MLLHPLHAATYRYYISFVIDAFNFITGNKQGIVFEPNFLNCRATTDSQFTNPRRLFDEPFHNTRGQFDEQFHNPRAPTDSQFTNPRDFFESQFVPDKTEIPQGP